MWIKLRVIELELPQIEIDHTITKKKQDQQTVEERINSSTGGQKDGWTDGPNGG